MLNYVNTFWQKVRKDVVIQKDLALRAEAPKRAPWYNHMEKADFFVL